MCRERLRRPEVEGEREIEAPGNVHASADLDRPPRAAWRCYLCPACGVIFGPLSQAARATLRLPRSHHWQLRRDKLGDEGPTGWRSPCLSVFDFPLFYFCTLYCISLPRSYTSCAMLRRRGLGVGRGAQISGRGRECGGYGGGCWLWKGRVRAKHRTRTERCGNRTPCGLGHSGSGVGLFGPQSVHKGEGHAPAHRVGSRGPNPPVVAAARVQAGGKGAHFRLPLGCTLVFSRAP